MKITSARAEGQVDGQRYTIKSTLMLAADQFAWLATVAAEETERQGQPITVSDVLRACIEAAREAEA